MTKGKQQAHTWDHKWPSSGHALMGRHHWNPTWHRLSWLCGTNGRSRARWRLTTPWPWRFGSTAHSASARTSGSWWRCCGRDSDGQSRRRWRETRWERESPVKPVAELTHTSCWWYKRKGHATCFLRALSPEWLDQHICLTAPLSLTAVFTEAERAGAIFTAKTKPAHWQRVAAGREDDGGD